AMDGASIAIVRAQDPRVRAYAQQATHDWTVADAQLASLARRAGIAMPSGNDPARLAKRQRLDANPALPFDFAYLRFELVDRGQHAALIQAERTGGANAALRGLAASKWPLVLQQDQQARAVAQAMGAQVTAPPLAASPLVVPAVALAPVPVPAPAPAP